MPSTCLICNRTGGKGSSVHVSFHRFSSKSEPAKHKRWLLALDLSKSDIADHRPSPAPTVTPASSEPTDGEDSAPGTRMSTSVSEVLLETPCDLQNQSSTWSNYKHNTAKFIVACTPNGAISFVSPLYVGSISDVELTHVSGFIESLNGKNGVSVMADRGFTMPFQLSTLGITLNIPPANEVKCGRKIASLRIHVERAIGRIKNYAILKGTLPLSMSRILKQIVHGWLIFNPFSFLLCRVSLMM